MAKGLNSAKEFLVILFLISLQFCIKIIGTEIAQRKGKNLNLHNLVSILKGILR